MSLSTTSDPILVTVADGIAELRFNRPHSLNALDVATAIAFRDGIARIVADKNTRVILLSGEGRAFMAGGDLHHFKSTGDRAAAARTLIEPIHAGLLAMVESGIPTIAAVQGAIAGAGMSVALLTDLAIAAENARFSMAYIKLAANPDCGGSWALTRLVGHRKAAEIALLSDALDAQTALRLGLVNQVVPVDGLMEAARALAMRIAQGPPLAMRKTRKLIDAAPAAGLEAQLDAELEAFAECAETAHFDEALEAFFGKRDARFT